MLYLNPPYDAELGPHHNRRMESVFLAQCYRWVKADGLLIFVIPVAALIPCARLLSSQFDRISVFRLEHPECVRFHQIVLVAKRRKAHAGPVDISEAVMRPCPHAGPTMFYK